MSHENGDLESILKAAPNRAAAPPPQKNIFKKKILDKMISSVLFDLPFSLYQPLKLADY